MLKLKTAIKLESLRLPFKQALVAASEMGAEGVEINARSELKPTELSRTGIRHLRKMLADLNLKVASVHFPTRRGYDEAADLERRLEATRAALTMAYDLGCRVVTNRIGQIPVDNEGPRATTMIQALTDLGMYSHKSGAWLALQTGFDESERIRKLIDALPPMAIGVDFDPAAMIINGFDVQQGMKLLAEHVMIFRARDAVNDLSQGRGLEVQLGRGSVDLPPLLAALEEQHYDGFLVIERDSGSEVVLHCAQAVEYLKSLFE
jgi:sugar phosphate isomerase/epimerase